jgi:hypothetical protein
MQGQVKYCPSCQAKTWHFNGVCEWNDGHAPIPGKSAKDFLAAHRQRTAATDRLIANVKRDAMTVKQFDETLGYLLSIILPPDVSGDDPNPGEVLDVLLKYSEEVRGTIIRQGLAKND